MNRLLVFLILVSFLSSCKKFFRENKIAGDKWELHYFELGGAGNNAMDLFLEHYGDAPEECHYWIHFNEDGSCISYYYTFDTLNYYSRGEWELLESDQLYLKLDDYVESTFYFEKEDNHNIVLSTEENIINIFNRRVFPVRMECERSQDGF